VTQGWRHCSNEELHGVYSTKYYKCEHNGCLTNSLEIQSLLGCSDVFLGNLYLKFSRNMEPPSEGPRVQRIISDLELYTLEDEGTMFL